MYECTIFQVYETRILFYLQIGGLVLFLYILYQLAHSKKKYWMLYSSSPDTAALAKFAIRILSIRVIGVMIERKFSASLANLVKMIRVKGHISVCSRKSKLHMEILANAVINEEKDA
jgi:hypothetical protein